MGKIGEHDVGDTVIIEANIDFNLPFVDDQEPAKLEDSSVEITDYKGEVVDEGELIRNDDGEYYYEWDTRGLEAGDYNVRIEAEQDGNFEVDKNFIRLTCD